MLIKVVIPAFRRPKSLKRLLESLFVAGKQADNFSVLVSLDGGHTSEVLEVAKQYKAKFESGRLEYLVHPKNMGLRSHILWCGNLAREFGSIVVLEDDLVVDKYFSIYAERAIDFYNNEIDVAGISLYSQQFNEFENLPFYASDIDGFANFFMQVPSSWGQIWTRAQWERFYDWYIDNLNVDLGSFVGMPSSAQRWPSSSWKKYFYAYLVHKNKYIVYPLRSYTTNSSDPGGFHNVNGVNFLQVPLLNREVYKSEIKFSRFGASRSRYDGFFERQHVELNGFPEVHSSSITLDIYGSKPLSYLKEYDYVITTRNVKKSLCGYPLSFKPIDLNFSYPEEGRGASIYLAKSEDVVEDGFFDKINRRYLLAQYFSPFDLAQNAIILSQLREKMGRLMSNLRGGL